MTHTLYSFRRCPYAMRARMALNIAGIDYEHREVLLRDKPQSMLDYSPKGTVPVLVTQDDEVIDESLAIMRWALTQNDPEGWVDANSAMTEDLIATNDGPFKHHLDRYKYASRYDESKARGETDEAHRVDAMKILSKLEARLETSSNLLGDARRLADIAIFPFIRQFAAVEAERFTQDCPNLRAWLTHHVESLLFKSIMAKHSLWQD